MNDRRNKSPHARIQDPRVRVADNDAFVTIAVLQQAKVGQRFVLTYSV